MASLLSAFFIIIVAGMINGSFALPAKFSSKWSFENIWLNFAFWALLVLPWLGAFFLTPQILHVYAATPWHLLLIILIGGFIFGAGQACFAVAMELIGIGLAFAISLGLGTGVGFALPFVTQHLSSILTPFGVITILGTLLALTGIVIANHAGKLRQLNHTQTNAHHAPTKTKHTWGIILAVFAGLTSAGQNVVFASTSQMQTIAVNLGASHLGAATIIWPAYMLSAFLPYAFFMLLLHARNKSFFVYRQFKAANHYFLTLVMGLFWYGALILYSSAAQLIGDLGPLVGWPLFLVLIILTSNFWGWQQREWENAGDKAKKTIALGLAFLVLSVVVLGYGSTLSP
jgi:L-rhamnose-H+ transport protein